MAAHKISALCLGFEFQRPQPTTVRGSRGDIAVVRQYVFRSFAGQRCKSTTCGGLCECPGHGKASRGGPVFKTYLDRTDFYSHRQRRVNTL